MTYIPAWYLLPVAAFWFIGGILLGKASTLSCLAVKELGRIARIGEKDVEP